jgi:hypothetical protein
MPQRLSCSAIFVRALTCSIGSLLSPLFNGKDLINRLSVKFEVELAHNPVFHELRFVVDNIHAPMWDSATLRYLLGKKRVDAGQVWIVSGIVA